MSPKRPTWDAPAHDQQNRVSRAPVSATSGAGNAGPPITLFQHALRLHRLTPDTPLFRGGGTVSRRRGASSPLGGASVRLRGRGRPGRRDPFRPLRGRPRSVVSAGPGTARSPVPLWERRTPQGSRAAGTGGPGPEDRPPAGPVRDRPHPRRRRTRPAHRGRHGAGHPPDPDHRALVEALRTCGGHGPGSPAGRRRGTDLAGGTGDRLGPGPRGGQAPPAQGRPPGRPALAAAQSRRRGITSTPTSRPRWPGRPRFTRSSGGPGTTPRSWITRGGCSMS